MTAEQFQQEYRLLDRVTEGEVETYHAQAAAGAMVMVHFLHGPPERQAPLLARIELLQAADRRKVLARTDVDGVTTIVTRFILDFTTLDEWLPPTTAEADHHAARASGEITAAFERLFDSAPAGAAGPGEFTAQFMAPSPAPPPEPEALVEPSADVAATAPPPPPPVPASGEAPSPAEPLAAAPTAPAEAEAGEFTRLFGAFRPEAAAPAPPLPPPATPNTPPSTPAPAPAGEPGEFTRRFAAPATSQPPGPSAPPPASPTPAGEPGEFTRRFTAAAPPPVGAQKREPAEFPAPTPPPPPPELPPPSPPPVSPPPPPGPMPPTTPPPEPPRAEAGEFTRMFGAAVRPADDVVAARPAQAAPLPEWPAFPAVPPPPAPPQAPAPPGEYTRLFGTPPLPHLPAPGPAPAPGAAGVGSRGDSYFDRLAVTPPAAPPQYPPQPPPVSAAPPAAFGPSEFTRVISAVTPPPQAPPPAPPLSATPARAGARGSTGLLIGLAVVVLLAVVLVLVIALS